jgi:quercetin dioxygenase-like cupin family protein
MACTTVPLASLPWTAGGHPLERKKSGGADLPILIEFAPGFRDPHVCTRGHVIYVIAGALGLELSDRHEVVEAGACCVLDSGTPHRAYTDGPAPVLLFIVSS